VLYLHELAFAKSLALQAGKLMSASLQVGHEATRKPDNSFVTKIDLAINRLVIESANKEFPADGILGEEESYLPADHARVWVVDPIDGTFAFKSGIPTSTVLIGLVENDEPVVAIIYNPFVNQLFSASKGSGAFLNGSRVSVNRNYTSLNGTPVGVTGPHASKLLDASLVRSRLETKRAHLWSLGSTGYEMALVGAGQFAGQIFGGNTRHDVMSGDLFIREAGGKVTDLKGGPLRYDKPVNGAIASNGILHEQLLNLVRN
jgi:myo-inositol-1(or 4)-monophosphatase